MKKNVLLFLILFISKYSFSQVGIGTTSPQSKLHVVGDARITNMDVYDPLTDSVVTVNSTTGLLTKADPKRFYNTIDQSVVFRGTASDFTNDGSEDVIWLAGETGKVLTLITPTPALIKRGRITYIVASGGDVTLAGLKPTIKNGTQISILSSGERIAIVPVDYAGGYGWYVINASQAL
ncbi:hypothetical protein [Rhizosphaericola mali]|uniref:VCBS repeat-containing protein n=1 Tax=Rhizosphaericola mali TaxID=2545455 RepID=A0A5P2G6D9_9BACT|nr:hypothetical protein [Rhizosphaericola mali]QES90268.1 hypothetical protein E0W69_016960 [Rhizosphaericola mali]